jgi:ATP-dependent Clp protease ATP-binding subunit ClpX
MIKLRRLNCSFCRKKDNEVLKLVAGSRVYICDECVAVASRLMADDSAALTPAQKQTVWDRLSIRVRKWLGLELHVNNYYASGG